MNKDAELLAEAYQRVLEEAKHCKAAIDVIVTSVKSVRTIKQ